MLLFQLKQRETGPKYTVRVSSSKTVPSFVGLYLGEELVILALLIPVQTEANQSSVR